MIGQNVQTNRPSDKSKQTVFKEMSRRKTAHHLTRAAILSTSIGAVRAQSRRKGRKSCDIFCILLWQLLAVNDFRTPSPRSSFARSTQRERSITVRTLPQAAYSGGTHVYIYCIRAICPYNQVK